MIHEINQSWIGKTNNLLVHAATESIQQWARDIKGMGIFIVIHKCGE